MSLKFINQQEGNTKVDYFQADAIEPTINEAKSVGSNPLVSADTSYSNMTTDFDMLTEGLW